MQATTTTFFDPEDPLSYAKTIQQFNLQIKQAHLPLDAYDPLLDEEDPHQIIEKYRDPMSRMCIALSKWYFAESNIIEPETPYEMRQCEVISYMDQEELYYVRWLCNGAYKKVVRFNLVFVREDQEAFLRRMAEAERMRGEAELMMKYYFMIDKTKTAKFDLKDN